MAWCYRRLVPAEGVDLPAVGDAGAGAVSWSDNGDGISRMGLSFPSDPGIRVCLFSKYRDGRKNVGVWYRFFPGRLPHVVADPGNPVVESGTGNTGFSGNFGNRPGCQLHGQIGHFRRQVGQSMLQIKTQIGHLIPGSVRDSPEGALTIDAIDQLRRTTLILVDEGVQGGDGLAAASFCRLG